LLCADIGVVNQPKNFGASLPGIYRQCAVAYTDFWESYKTVIPSKRHRLVGKETGQTNPIERLNKWVGVKNHQIPPPIGTPLIKGGRGDRT
jgi:insertion element IS1 protein InsB